MFESHSMFGYAYFSALSCPIDIEALGRADPPFKQSYQMATGFNPREPNDAYDDLDLYRVHKSTPLVTVLSQMDSLHSLSSYFAELNFNIILFYI
jgi:hypothetical protein